jgi:hypothetical protein
MVKKLQSEPIEDNRIDFEDGYGNRPDQEEDGHAAAAAEEVAKQLVRDDPAQPEFQDLLSRMQDELQLATQRYGPQTPPRQVRPVGRQLIGPRNF